MTTAPISIKPAGFRVLVLPDKVKELEDFEKSDDGTYTHKSGIVLPAEETHKDLDRERGAQTFGTVVKIGRTAWKAYDDGEPWAEVGDRVSYARHGGSFIVDPKTHVEYVLLNDNDITAVLED